MGGEGRNKSFGSARYNGCIRGQLEFYIYDIEEFAYMLKETNKNLLFYYYLTKDLLIFYSYNFTNLSAEFLSNNEVKMVCSIKMICFEDETFSFILFLYQSNKTKGFCG